MMKNKRQPINPIVNTRILPALVLLFCVCSTRADDRKLVRVPATIDEKKENTQEKNKKSTIETEVTSLKDSKPNIADDATKGIVLDRDPSKRLFLNVKSR